MLKREYISVLTQNGESRALQGWGDVLSLGRCLVLGEEGALVGGP